MLAFRSWGAVKTLNSLNLTYHVNFLRTINVLFHKGRGGGRKKISSLDFTTHVNFLCTISVNMVLSGSGGAEKMTQHNLSCQLFATTIKILLCTGGGD